MMVALFSTNDTVNGKSCTQANTRGPCPRVDYSFVVAGMTTRGMVWYGIYIYILFCDNGMVWYRSGSADNTRRRPGARGLLLWRGQ